MTMARTARVSAAGLLLALGACAAEPPPPPVAEVTVSAGGSVNPGPDGTPAPVVVRIFGLAGEARFRGADFFQLYEAAEATLGPDLVTAERVTLSPGESATRSVTIERGITHLGAIAAFRDIDRAVWQDAVPVGGGEGDPAVTVRVEGTRIAMTAR